MISEGHTCKCSFSCEFVVEDYFADSKELTDLVLKSLNSSWAAKREQEESEKQKRVEEEKAQHKLIWARIQQELADDDKG